MPSHTLTQAGARPTTPLPGSLLSLQRLPPDAADAQEAEEALVADPRGGLSPAQVVDRKLLAQCRAGNPGLFLQAAGRPQDIRRIPQPRQAPAPVAQEAGHEPAPAGGV
jgi:hypothetical protein